MTLFFIALIPCVLSLLLWIFSKKINWIEASTSCVAGFISAIIIYYTATTTLTADTQTLSGRVIQAGHIGAWVEYYEYAVYRTEYYWTTETRHRSVGTGKNRHSESYTVRVQKSRQVFDHWQPTTRNHPDEYMEQDTFSTVGISSGTYSDIINKFGEEGKSKGSRTTGEHHSRMISGDPYDYHSINKNGFIYPVNVSAEFVNKIKACKTVFSYIDVPPSIKIYPYPVNNNRFSSRRLVGEWSKEEVNTLMLDQMNAVLGPAKKVNIILVMFKDKDSDYGDYQEAAWIGGKKNDLVICCSKTDDKIQWCKVCGWSESYLAKANIKTIVMDNGFNQKSMALINEEIVNNYKIKDWKKFDYLVIDIPQGYIITHTCIVFAVYIGLMCFFWFNEFEQTSPFYYFFKIYEAINYKVKKSFKKSGIKEKFNEIVNKIKAKIVKSYNSITLYLKSVKSKIKSIRLHK